ncbi:unnamed protein product [Gordionus sp. m RMFG-2023]|uniref:uncharacterized protein LOC135924488 n=1 Tax=Gordionus sp. m RMFG-2023 TaxID=3053472 RepID=UPI0030E36225
MNYKFLPIFLSFYIPIITTTDWTNGPNVCVAKITILERVQENFDDYEPIRFKRTSVFPIRTRIVCQDYYDVRVCLYRIYRGPRLLEEYAKTYSCCHGYTTAKNRLQPYCNQSLVLKNMTKTLKGLNYIRKNPSIVNTSQLFKILNTKGNITLFLPINNSAFLDQNIISEYLPRGLILNDMQRIVMGSDSYGLHFTIHKVNSRRFQWAVNCVTVIKEYFTTQGIIYKLKDQLPRTKQTVYDFLKQQEPNSTMAKYLIVSGLANLTLDPGKYYTIILPSNLVLNQLSPQLIQDLASNVECSKETLKMHIIEKWICPCLYKKPQAFKSLEGSIVNISSNMINNESITDTRVLSNGVIIFMDLVLISNKSISLVEILQGESQASVFMNYFIRYNLSILNEIRDKLVLIPDNAAFLNLDQNIKEKLRQNISYVMEFLENYIKPSNTLDRVEHLEVANDSVYNDYKHKNGVLDNLQCLRKISKKIYYFCGGKFRFIPKALVPLPANLSEILAGYSEISIFRQFLDRSNLTFKRNVYYTIWVPTNRALENIVNVSVENFVKIHIYPGLHYDHCYQAKGNEFYLNPKLSYLYNEDGNIIYVPPNWPINVINVNIIKWDILGQNFLIHIVDNYFDGNIVKLILNFDHTKNHYG